MGKYPWPLLREWLKLRFAIKASIVTVRLDRELDEENRPSMAELRAENERLRKGLQRIDYYYELNDGDELRLNDAIEIDVKAMREIHRLLKSE